MKTPSRLFALFALLALSACNDRQAQQQSAAPSPPDEQEVERRVQARLAEERLAENQRRAEERDQQLSERERELKQRERDLREQQQNAARETPEPERTTVVTERRGRVEGAESYQIFYDALAPYGGWLEVENYGYVWQPRVAVERRGWRPYTDGRWAYTDYGWTWISDEPFGWAVYHYGRWAHLRRLGWVWVPDDDWAPAWVSWRYSDRFIGWAPLPPEARFDGAGGIREWADTRFSIGTSEYVFVPASEFGDDRLADAALPPEQNVTIINETTNVTNIINNNATIVNYGPAFDIVRQRARRPIAQLTVQKTQVTKGGQNTAVVKGQTVQFAAPTIRKANAPAAKPMQVKARESDAKATSSAPPPTSATAAQQARQQRPPQPHGQSSQTATPAPQSASTSAIVAQPTATPESQATPDPRTRAQQQRQQQQRALEAQQAAERAQQQALRQQQLQQQQQNQLERQRQRQLQRATPGQSAPATDTTSPGTNTANTPTPPPNPGILLPRRGAEQNAPATPAPTLPVGNASTPATRAPHERVTPPAPLIPQPQQSPAAAVERPAVLPRGEAAGSPSPGVPLRAR